MIDNAPQEVCILGGGPSLDSFERHGEVWCLAHQGDLIGTGKGQPDRIIEAHSKAIVEANSPAHIHRLSAWANKVPLYTPWDWGEPLGHYHTTITHEDLNHITTMFESSPSYMIALAIAAEIPDIYLFGIDAEAGLEYSYQRPNLWYLIGKAEGMGLNVHLPKEHPFYKSQWPSGVYGHPNEATKYWYSLGRGLNPAQQKGPSGPTRSRETLEAGLNPGDIVTMKDGNNWLVETRGRRACLGKQQLGDVKPRE